MAFPWVSRERFWASQALTATYNFGTADGSPTPAQTPNVFISFELSGFSGAMDIQGRATPDHGWTNVRYVLVTGDGALDPVATQLSFTLITGTRTYRVVDYWPEMRIVMTRTAGTITQAAWWGHEGGSGYFPGQVDTEFPAASALADGVANPTAPQAFAHTMVWDPQNSQWVRMRILPDTAGGGDGLAVTSALLPASPMLYNALYGLAGTFDRKRSKTSSSQLASAARTASTNGADQTFVNEIGVMIVLNVTIASGTGGLQVLVQGKDSISGNYFALNATPAAVTAIGTTVYVVAAAALTAAGGITQVTQMGVPRTWRVRVVHGDASSYTYSVSAQTL